MSGIASDHVPHAHARVMSPNTINLGIQSGTLGRNATKGNLYILNYSEEYTGDFLAMMLDTHPDHLLCRMSEDHEYVTEKLKWYYSHISTYSRSRKCERCEKQTFDHTFDKQYGLYHCAIASVLQTSSCSSGSREGIVKDFEFSRLTAPDDEASDTIPDLFQAYYSAVAEYLGVCHESQTHDKTKGTEEGVSTPCEQTSVKVPWSTQQCLVSITSSVDLITPAPVANVGRDLVSDKWDNTSHQPEASSSQSSIRQDGPSSRGVSEKGIRVLFIV